MKKKYLLFFSSIVLLLLALGISYYNSNLSVMKCSTIKEKTLIRIYNNYSESTGDILLDLLFNGQRLAYDAATSTYYLPLSLSEKKWENGRFSTTCKDIKISFLDSFLEQDKLTCISENRSFRFIAYNTAQYKEYKLVFTGMPTMTITTKEVVDSQRVLADFSLFDNTKNNLIKSEGYFKVRGATSRNYPKYSYSVDLIKKTNNGSYVNNDVSFLGMRKDDDWILNALYNDDTKIRNTLSFYLWNEIGAKKIDSTAFYGSHMEYVEVFIDNQYVGLYSLMEPIDYKQLNLNLTNEEYLYKRTYGTVLNIDAFNLEMGTASTENSLNGFEFKGKLSEMSSNVWLPLNDLVLLLHEPSEKTSKELVDDMINIDNCLDVWIFLQIVNGSDNITKNMYYAYKLDGGKHDMYFIPWDLDLTWGYEYTEENSFFSRFDETNISKDILWQPGQKIYDMDINNAKNLVLEKWKSYRDTILSDKSIIKLIIKYQDLLINSGAMERDEACWYQSPHTADFTETTEYALKRLQYLDLKFQNP